MRDHCDKIKIVKFPISAKMALSTADRLRTYSNRNWLDQFHEPLPVVSITESANRSPLTLSQKIQLGLKSVFCLRG